MSTLGAVQGEKKKKRSGENSCFLYTTIKSIFLVQPSFLQNLGGLSRHFYSLMEKSPDLLCCLATESVSKNHKGENLQKTGGTKLIIECLMANWGER